MFRKTVLCFMLTVTLLISACGPIATPPPTTSPTAIPTTAPIAESTAIATALPAPTPISLTDGLGRTVTLAAPAQHIVSIAPSGTEILFAIGASPQVIGRDHNSDYPEAAKKVPDIGGSDVSDKLNTELILAAKPDLVLAASITPAEQIKALETLGMTVFVLSNPTDLDGMYSNLRTAAKLTGHEAETETLIASLQARVKAIEDKVANAQEKPLVFYEIDSTDAKAPWTSGPGTFIDTLIGMAAGRNVGASLKDQWAQISLEELVRQDPDIIVLGDSVWGGITPDLVKQRGGWGALKAVKNGMIFPFDDSTMSRPGPRLVDGLEAMAKLIHPELYK
jgi:iron complex transport system substrate-binding protein